MLVGRQLGIGVLRSAVDAAIGGVGGVVLVAGEAGMGKTALAAEAVVYAKARGAVAVWGTCWEGDGAPGFWPWIQVVRALAGDSGDEAGRAVLAELTGVTGARGGVLGDESAVRFRTYDVAVTYLRGRAAQRPLVVAVDDLHWADLSSLRLLVFLARQLRDVAVLVIGTYRDVEVAVGDHPVWRLLAELAGQAELVQLTGLTAGEVGELLEMVCGEQPPTALVGVVHDRTAGNPFFVQQIARLLASQGAPLDRGPVTGVPPAVGDVLARRLARLPGEVVDLLAVASVVGRRFPIATVFALKPTRARNPLGPEYGDVAGGAAVEHALTRTVRDSAALLDATSGPALGDPYRAPPPARRFAAEVGADAGRLRIAYTTRTPEGDRGHRDCVAAAEHAARLCASLGHEVTEADWPGFTPEVGAAIWLMINAATAWILRYWIRRVGREPGPDEIEPLTRALWQAGEKVTAAQWLLAVEDIQRFGRIVAGFFASYDAFLTPTMSTPPLPIGAIISTPEDPWRSLELSGQTVRYAGVVANLTGNPAMSVPLWWNDDGVPIGVHFLGRFGDEATLIRLASQLEAHQPWAARLPAVHAATLSRL
jgi:RecA/RadA recombinase